MTKRKSTITFRGAAARQFAEEVLGLKGEKPKAVPPVKIAKGSAEGNPAAMEEAAKTVRE